MEPLHDAQNKLAETIYAIPARTQAGMVAKLRSFVAYNKEIIKPGGGPPGDIILASACHDALAFPNTAVPASPACQSPDAELIGMCDEFAAQLWKIRSLATELPDNDEREKVTNPLYAQQDRLDHRISAIRAHTLDGILAKARHIVLSMPDVLEEPDPGIDRAFFASILQDLLVEPPPPETTSQEWDEIRRLYEATEANRRTKGSAAAMSSTGSILDIGRRINSLSVAYNELDETRPVGLDSIAADRRETQMSILLDEQVLLQQLTMALRPQTLAEAAVQLAILFYNMDYEMDTDDVDKLHEGFRKIQRTTVGAVRAVAAAAGIDLTQFAAHDLISLMDARCPAEAQESA